jgi:hypothetical protein
VNWHQILQIRQDKPVKSEFSQNRLPQMPGRTPAYRGGRAGSGILGENAYSCQPTRRIWQYLI